TEDGRSGARIARVAALAAGADGALLWRGSGATLDNRGSFGPLQPSDALLRTASTIVADNRAAVTETTEAGTVVTLQLGQPPIGALQLLFASGRLVAEPELARLASFAVRVAHALRFAERAGELGLELAQTRSLLAVVGEAISHLSLAHALDTAVGHLSLLLAEDRVAVYLVDDGTVTAAASRGMNGPHEGVAAAVLGLALSGRRGHLAFDRDRDGELGSAAAEAEDADVRTVIALPLMIADEPIGLLALYPEEPRELTTGEVTLLEALAVQLAVAVHNAQLHERATELAARLEGVLELERDAARRLQALYEVSRSFAQSLSLETTLDVLAESIVTLLGVDAAVIRMPDERGVDFTARAVHVDDRRVDAAARAILSRPQPFPRTELEALVESGRPLVVTASHAQALGGSLALLAPFLEKGSSCAVVPVTSAGELVATLTIVSLHPSRPVAGETAETALSIAGQAALAIDNARLYAQQKEFADTMQRSLLPRAAPDPPGLELGDVYESSARVDVGGDVYDYLQLDDGRLAVVLGDVMGHGVEATADMAMAKFVFRSLARELTDPGAFLAAANDVVASDIAPGKFITMVEVVIDAERGEVACAGGGHPAPRLVLPDGTVRSIDARGLALGIEPKQEYATIRAELPPGASVVLYTDGVVEARRGGEQFGLERFDQLLAERHEQPPGEIALAALAACREWSQGDIGDDFAVVVIKRTAAA
nr:SpoIIE family protein phosphatase [Actinomycetota bacterium]